MAEATSATPEINFTGVYTELLSYHTQNNGSLAVPSSHPALSRIADALTSGGIENLLNQRWDEQLAQLRNYKARHGNCNVPPTHPTLGKWAADQREYYKLYESQKPSPLTPQRYEQLKNLGLTTNRWEKRLEELRTYKEEHGHTDVPMEHPKLGVWVFNQREAYEFERETMPQDRIDALDALGFNWNRWGRKRLKAREDAWDVQFNKLVDYMKEHGHSNISQHDKEHDKLGKWVKNQRYEYRKYHNKGLGPSRLGRDRIDKLNEIKFQWRLRPERIPWEDRFQALAQYKEQHGTCRVSLQVPELGKWAKYQRDQYCLFMKGKKAKITQEKVDKLCSLGFEESLEERVASGLPGEEGHVAAAGGEEQVAVMHHQEVVGYYPGQITYGAQQAQPGSGAIQYQAGGVHYN